MHVNADRQEIEQRGFGAIDFVQEAGGGCVAYGTKYSVGKALTLVASVNVVVINFGLKASKERGGSLRAPRRGREGAFRLRFALFPCAILLMFPALWSEYAALVLSYEGRVSWRRKTRNVRVWREYDDCCLRSTSEIGGRERK